MSLLICPTTKFTLGVFPRVYKYHAQRALSSVFIGGKLSAWKWICIAKSLSNVALMVCAVLLIEREREEGRKRDNDRRFLCIINLVRLRGIDKKSIWWEFSMPPPSTGNLLFMELGDFCYLIIMMWTVRLSRFFTTLISFAYRSFSKAHSNGCFSR